MNEKAKNTLTLTEASRLSGIPYQKLRICLQKGHFDFGLGYKTKETNKNH